MIAQYGSINSAKLFLQTSQSNASILMLKTIGKANANLLGSILEILPTIYSQKEVNKIFKKYDYLTESLTLIHCIPINKLLIANKIYLEKKDYFNLAYQMNNLLACKIIYEQEVQESIEINQYTFIGLLHNQLNFLSELLSDFFSHKKKVTFQSFTFSEGKNCIDILETHYEKLCKQKNFSISSKICGEIINQENFRLIASIAKAFEYRHWQISNDCL